MVSLKKIYFALLSGNSKQQFSKL